MAEYSNENRGALFRNEERKTDKSPEYGGSLNVDGKDYYLSAWVKEGKKGKFFSLSVKPKDAPMRDKIPATSKWAEPEADPYDDPVPF